MRDFSKHIIYALIILVLVSGIYALLTESLRSPQELSLSDFVKAINAGEIQKITIRESALEAVKKDGATVRSKKEPGVGLIELLKDYGVTSERLGEVAIEVKETGGLSFWLGVILPIVLPILLIGFFIWWTARQVQRGSMQAFTFGQSRARLISPETTKERVLFKDVAGVKEAKEELEEVVDFLKNPKKFFDIGARIPRGVLLMGAPGTGKTLLARAVAGEANVPFFHISGSEFVEMFVGVGASRVRDLFKIAKKAAPAIIFMDEIDAVGRHRGAGLGGGHDEREQTLNQILVEMDGFETNESVIVMAASVTGDTPVLMKQDGQYALKSIAEVIDPYYQEGEENIEKPATGLSVLGMERITPQNPKLRGRTFFGSSAFKNVRSVFRHKVNEIYNIEFLGGAMRTTGNHSVFIRTKQGIAAKRVDELRAGEFLVDIPYVANRANKARRKVRAHSFVSSFSRTLPVYTYYFDAELEYAFAMQSRGILSQAAVAETIGVSQTTVSKWYRTSRVPRIMSHAYFLHQLPATVDVTPELMRLFGYYVADGYARKDIDFCFNRKETAYIEDVKELMHSIFGLRPRAERMITPNAVNIVYSSKPLADFFIRYCGKGARGKHVPEFLFEAPRDYFVEFLRGYWRGDGHQDKRGRLEFTSVSKQLILELNWLARMHGMKSYIHTFIAKAGRRIDGGKPLGATVAYRLGFGKTQNPFTDVSGKKSIKRAKIIKITKVSYDGYVYDFCGCENEAFFGGEVPVLLHNTNRPDVLDPALLRPGRFDRRVVLDSPDVNDREEILKIHARNKPFVKDISLRLIAERTPGFSGADLANLMNEGAILAARHDRKVITQQDLTVSIEKVLLGPERKSHVLTQKEKEISAYHEAGHALVASSLPHADPVHKISIVARGHAAGYTLKLPVEERHFFSRSHFFDELAAALGGYAAEKLMFGEVTTGPHDDLKKATNMARDLVTRYGMSEKLGPAVFGEREELVFLGKEIGTERNYSEETARLIDQEVRGIIDNALKRAKEVIMRKKIKLEAIAKRLIQKETIEKDEFQALMQAA